MPTHTIYTTATRADIRSLAALLPEIMSGRAPDRLGIRHGFSMRLAVAFLSKIKQAFIVKSRGGTDEAGIKWPPLTKAYVAYQRRFGKGEKSALKKAARLGRANSRAPGGKDGLLTAAQERLWWQIYRRNLAWLAAREPLAEAKGHAAAIAWNELKKQGAKTKLEVFGNRQVEILRDTGILFNSLSPGELRESGPDATYSPPGGEGGGEQIVRDGPGHLIVGTNVAYAAAHHHAKTPNRLRRLWPDGGSIPAAWMDDFAKKAAGGLRKAVELLAADLGRGGRI